MSNVDPLDDSSDDLNWARQIIAAVGKREARRILDDYVAIYENPRVPKKDREIAECRAKALRSLM
jgi:hypothetical protein